MPKITEHPGVTIQEPKKVGYPYHVIFKHPLLGGKQVGRTIHTTEGTAARESAKKISQLLRSPNDWKKKPEYINETLWTVWSGSVANEEKVRDAAIETLKETTDSIDVSNMTTDQIIACLFSPKPFYFEPRNGPTERPSFSQAVAKKMREILEENITLRKKNDELKTLCAQRDLQIGDDYAPKPIKSAISDFLSGDIKIKGTNGDERTKAKYRNCLNLLTRSMPEGVMIAAISPAQVIAHLQALANGDFTPEHRRKIGKKVGVVYVKQSAIYINTFLVHQTKGMYKPFAVQDWIKKFVKAAVEAQEPSDPYWLDQAEVDSLCSHLPEFWTDCVNLQWAMGCRPEELCNLQASKVTMNGEIRIEVAKLMDGSRTVWKAKTRRSYGAVHLPPFATATVEKLLARKEFLLLPDDVALHGGVKTNKGQGFDRLNKIWDKTSFCRQYAAQLKEAAVKAGLDAERIDCRTMRRSAGRRILIKGNFDLNLAAAILRDLPSTVEKHYARILPRDVKQPEAK